MAPFVALGLVGLAAAAVIGRTAYRPPPHSSSLPSGPRPARLAQPIGTTQRAAPDASHAAPPTSDVAYPPPVAAATATPTPLPGGLLLPPADVVSDTVTITGSPRSACLSKIAQALDSQDVTPMLDVIGHYVDSNAPYRKLTKPETAALIQGLFDAGSQPVLLGYFDSMHLTLYTSGWVGPVAIPTPVTPVPTPRPEWVDGPVWPPVYTVGEVAPGVGVWLFLAGAPGSSGCTLTSLFVGVDFYSDVRDTAIQNQEDYLGDAMTQDSPWRLEPAVYHRIVP